MADYGLPDPILSSIQGGFAPDPTAPSGVSMVPPVDDGSLHPAILSGLFGMPMPQQIVDHEDNGGVTPTPQPPPPPPPPPDQGSNSKGPQKKMLGAAPIAPGLAGGPDAAPEIADTVPSVTGGQLPSAPTNAAPAPAHPDYPVSVTMPTPAEERQRAQQDAAAQKQAAAQAAYQASPEGIQQHADAMDQASIQKQQQANQQDAAAQEAQNTATANAIQAHMQRQADQAKADAAKQAAYQADVDKYTQQYAQQVQDAANYHVNDDRSVGAGGLIAIALSGIGNALDHYHGPNAAAQIIQNNIQNRINDQWRQKDALAKKATGTAAIINQFRQNAMDDRQAQALQTASELQKTSDQLKLIAAQSANPQVQANAMKTSAILDQNSAAIVRGEAVRGAQAKQAAQELALKKEQLAQGWAGVGLRKQELAQSDKHFEEQLKQQAGFHADEMKAEADKLAAMGHQAKAAALAKQAEDVRNGGMVAPTGAAITVKNPDGTVTKQPQYDVMRQQDGTPWIMGDDFKKEVNPYKVRDSAEKAINAIDATRKLREESGGDYTNYSEDANKKIAELQRATMALMGTMGGNASPRSAEILKQIQKQLTGTGDATSKLKAIEPILTQARGDIISDLDTTYRSGGYTGKPIGYQFPDPLANKGTFDAQHAEDRDVLKADVPVPDQDMLEPGGFVKYLATPESRELYKRANEAGIFPSQLKALDQYGAALKSTDPSVSGPALARLQGIVDDPKFPQGVRDVARQYLGTHLESELPSLPQFQPQSSPLPEPVAHYIANRLPENK